MEEPNLTQKQKSQATHSQKDTALSVLPLDLSQEKATAEAILLLMAMMRSQESIKEIYLGSSD